MYVYVLDKNNNPLMPTQRGNRVRILLKQGLAKVVYQKPFTIKLTYDIENPQIQPLFGGTDPGRTNIGEAVIKEDGEAVYLAEVKTANKDVPDHMKDRVAHRRASRNGERKVRQRRAIKNNTIFAREPVAIGDTLVKQIAYKYLSVLQKEKSVKEFYLAAKNLLKIIISLTQKLDL